MSKSETTEKSKEYVLNLPKGYEVAKSSRKSNAINFAKLPLDEPWMGKILSIDEKEIDIKDGKKTVKKMVHELTCETIPDKKTVKCRIQHSVNELLEIDDGNQDKYINEILYIINHGYTTTKTGRKFADIEAIILKSKK